MYNPFSFVSTIISSINPSFSISSSVSFVFISSLSKHYCSSKFDWLLKMMIIWYTFFFMNKLRGREDQPPLNKICLFLFDVFAHFGFVMERGLDSGSRTNKKINLITELFSFMLLVSDVLYFALHKCGWSVRYSMAVCRVICGNIDNSRQSICVFLNIFAWSYFSSAK